MNSVELVGNLTKDPELRYTKDNVAVASFNIAINRMNEGVDFIPIKVFNKQAENCKKYLAKGSKVAIEGSIRTGSYEKEDGTKIYTTEIMANRVHFLSSNTNTQETQNQVQNEPQNKSSNELDDEVFAQFGDSISIDDDGIAF
jgi:single-strand DNA-binding protein